MGTRKTALVLDWLDQTNGEQKAWAISFLRREQVIAGQLRGEALSPGWLAISSVQGLQKEANADQLRLLRKLDGRMRRAWDEKQRRATPGKRAYQFQMDNAVRRKLAYLKRITLLPLERIVQGLIEEAYKDSLPIKKPPVPKKKPPVSNFGPKLLMPPYDQALVQTRQEKQELKKRAEELAHETYRLVRALEVANIPHPALTSDKLHKLKRKAERLMEGKLT